MMRAVTQCHMLHVTCWGSYHILIMLTNHKNNQLQNKLIVQNINIQI